MPSLLDRARVALSNKLLRVPSDGAGGGQSGFVFPNWKTGPRLGAEAVLRGYGEMPWLRAFTQKIAHDVATTSWQLMTATSGGEKGRAVRDVAIQRAMSRSSRTRLLAQRAAQNQLREIVSHPLLDLLTSGNAYFPGLVSMELTQLHVDLVGELAWLLNPNELGMPVTALPFPPTWIMLMPRETGGTYRVVGPSATYEVPEANIFYAYHPNPSNPFGRGTGLAQVLGDELETDEAAAKHTKDWFKNRAIPPVLISGLGVGLPELQRLEEKWLSKYQRVGAGWLPQFLGRDVTVHQLSQTFEQQQLGQLRERERDMIRQVFGIPPEIVGITESSNRATIESADFIYQSRVIIPRLEFLRAVLQERLAPRFDERIIIDYVSPVQEDRQFLLEVRKAAPWSFTVDEWRHLADVDALPERRGEVFMVPFNLTPTKLEVEAAPLPLPGPAQPGPQSLLPAPEPAAKRAIALHSIAKASARKIADAAKAKTLVDATLPGMQQLIGDFGQVSIDATGGDAETFDLSDPRVEGHLREFAAERMADTVNATTKERIRDTLAEGFAAGEPMADLEQRIRDVFATASDSRAALIARTEVTRSSSFGAVEGMKQAGVEQKEWMSVQDGATREDHAEMDGQVVDIEDDFTAPDGSTAPYPGEFGDPAQDCNCRCIPQPVMSGDRAARSSASRRKAQWKSLEARRRPYVRRIAALLQGAFRQQERAVVAALRA